MKTILAIALSAAFCFSSYALAEGYDYTLDPGDEGYDGAAVLDASTLFFEGGLQPVVDYCKESKGEGQTVLECVDKIYYSVALDAVKAAAFLGAEQGLAIGKDACAATTSRETFTF